MADTPFFRVERDLEDVIRRLRVIENMDTPPLRTLGSDLDKLEDRVQRMDTEGTHVTQVRLKNIEEDIREIKEDTKAVRTTVRSALITAALSIASSIILFFLLRGGT